MREYLSRLIEFLRFAGGAFLDMGAIGITSIRIMMLRCFILACWGMLLSGAFAFAGLVNIVDRGEDTLLHVAASEGHVFIIKQLIEGGVDVNVEDGKGLTPLYYAIEKEHMEVAQLLLRAGASVDVWGGDRAGHAYRPRYRSVTGQQESLFHAVVRDGSMRVFNLFMEEAVDLNLEMRDSKECTPLHVAALLGKMDHVKALLNAGADPNAKDFTGRVPLHYAASSSNPRVIVLLLDAGAQVNVLEAPDQADTVWGTGPTPLEIAMDAFECENVCVLKDAGGRVRDSIMETEDIPDVCNCWTPGAYMRRYRDEL